MTIDPTTDHGQPSPADLFAEQRTRAAAARLPTRRPGDVHRLLRCQVCGTPRLVFGDHAGVTSCHKLDSHPERRAVAMVPNLDATPTPHPTSGAA